MLGTIQGNTAITGVQFGDEGKGQIVDASLVDAPKQRNSREENAQINDGEVPQRFRKSPHVERQKDIASLESIAEIS